MRLISALLPLFFFSDGQFGFVNLFLLPAQHFWQTVWLPLRGLQAGPLCVCVYVDVHTLHHKCLILSVL
uniref:Putative secreted protein n=1 Tax=Anopheles marajoara TaxID=58244 RepID=A0A2M4CF05_9DIPT